MHTKPKLLQAGALPEKHARGLREAFDVIEVSGDAEDIAAAARANGPTIRAMTVRHAHLDAETLAMMANLEIISSYSAGMDGIDLGAVRARGIPVYNTSHILAEDVADLGLSMLLAVTRGLTRGHDFVRAGKWVHGTLPLQRSVRGLNIGIVGLGHVGLALSRRLAPLGAIWGYSDPEQKPVEGQWFPDAGALADWAQVLIVTCPLMPQTRRMINDDILRRLGRDGYLISIARGEIVDESAVLAALAADELAGLAIDVFENEPNVPEALMADPRVVLSPHMGSGTQETRERMGDAMLEALLSHFGKEPAKA